MFRVTLALALAGLMSSSTIAQTTYYVDVSNSSADDANSGLAAAPWKNLNFALGPSSGIAAGDTLRIRSGNYDTDSGTNSDSVTFPIEIPAGVHIEGVNSSDGTPSLAERPRIGGDAAGSATHLFAVTASTADKTTGTISRLTFVGENEASLDSPIALKVIAENGHTAHIAFENNICERPHMNDSGASGLATIDMIVEDGAVAGGIADCTIETSNRGGIEMTSSQEDLNTGPTKSEFLIDIDGNLISNPAGAYSTFGIRWHAPTPSSPRSQPPRLGAGAWRDNMILARGENMQNGIEVIAEEYTNFGTNADINNNTIDGCGSAGLVIRMDGWDPTEQLPEFAGGINQNIIVDCVDSGVVAYWDETNHGSDDGAGYINPSFVGNIVADNGGYGILLRNRGDASTGGLSCSNNTIVYNETGGIGYVGLNVTAFGSASTHSSEIVYFNNPDGMGGYDNQIVGLTSTQITNVESYVNYSCWQGLGASSLASNNNTDQLPYISRDVRVYHISTETSPCVDTGSAGSLLTDIDGEDRVQDGNCDSTSVVDMGADEFTEDCP